MLQLKAHGCQRLLALGFGLSLAAGCGEAGSERDGSWSAEPLTIEADVRVIASGGHRLGSFLVLGGNSRRLVADDSGVYWYDNHGAVFGQRRGEGEVVQFLPGVASLDDALQQGSQLVMGIASSADRLFVADAYATSSIDYVSAQFPGRVWSVPKDGAAPSLWLESEDELLVPLTVQGEHLFLVGLGDMATSRYYRAKLDGGALEPIELDVEFLEQYVTGPAFYWPARTNPLRVHLHDRPSEQVTQMNAHTYHACPGYFVSRFLQSSAVLIHRGRSREADSLPLMEGFGLGTACDARYAYLYTSAWSEAGAPEDGHIVRIDVASGQSTYLVWPDMPPSDAAVVADIAGEDAENIYIISGDRLLAVRKP